MSEKATELLRLIREQTADMRQGSYQPQERHVAFSLDQATDLENDRSFQNFLTEDFRMPPASGWDGCPLHGKVHLEYRKDGQVECRKCHREADRLRYATSAKVRAAQRVRNGQRQTGVLHTPEEYRARDAAYSRAYRARKREARLGRPEAAKESSS